VGTTGLADMTVGFPMLDDELLAFSERLPADYKLRGLKLRWFFKEALKGFLPDEIIVKKKQGFGLPFGVWATRDEGLKALAAFFAVIHRDGVMPLGAREMLEAEMLALEGMRHIIADPRFAAIRNDELIAEIARLSKLVGVLADRATSLPELVDTRHAA